MFVQGVYAKALENNDDSKAKQARDDYGAMLQALLMRETYGMDLSNLQMTVGGQYVGRRRTT